ncbi:hypothetical protein [Oxynema aestuarii]|nr:hypothetical protein [Oxynema aestuarii]
MRVLAPVIPTDRRSRVADESEGEGGEFDLKYLLTKVIYSI